MGIMRLPIFYPHFRHGSTLIFILHLKKMGNSIQHKKARQLQMSQRAVCVPVQLSLDLHSVLEGEHQPPIVVGRGLLHHRQPKGVVKLRDASLPLMYSEHGPADDVSSGLPLLFLLLEGVHPGLGFLVPRHIAIVAFGIFILTLCAPGVLLDAPLGQFCYHRNPLEQLVQLCVNGGAVGEVVLHDAAVLQQSVLAVQQLIERYQEPGLDVLLHQMRSAALFPVAELAVALPDNPAVLAVGVPDLGAVVAAAIAACQRQAENVDFRRNRMSFFGGQHSSVYSPYTPLHLPA